MKQGKISLRDLSWILASFTKGLGINLSAVRSGRLRYPLARPTASYINLSTHPYRYGVETLIKYI
jgi:hypothetical protein